MTLQLQVSQSKKPPFFFHIFSLNCERDIRWGFKENAIEIYSKIFTLEFTSRTSIYSHVPLRWCRMCEIAVDYHHHLYWQLLIQMQIHYHISILDFAVGKLQTISIECASPFPPPSLIFFISRYWCSHHSRELIVKLHLNIVSLYSTIILIFRHLQHKMFYFSLSLVFNCAHAMCWSCQHKKILVIWSL